MEYIDTSSNPVPKLAQQPVEIRATGQLRVQIVEESKGETFMTAKVYDPETKRTQMAEQMRKSKRQELVSKKRWDLVLNQLQREEEQHCGLAFSHLPE